MSYRSDVDDLVAKVRSCLELQGKVDAYFHRDDRALGDFWENIEEELRDRELLLVFLSPGTATSEWQPKELAYWVDHHGQDGIKRILYVSVDGTSPPDPLLASAPDKTRQKLRNLEKVFCSNDPAKASHCATAVLKALHIAPAPFDDLPSKLSVSYEKHLTATYINANGKLSMELVQQGYPRDWPSVSQNGKPDEPGYIDNPLDTEQHGSYREAQVRVDARIGPSGPASEALVFPEAGPRQRIFNPGETLNVGVLVSGGIAPGINAVISAIVERHDIYKKAMLRNDPAHEVEVYGYQEGFRSLCRVRTNHKRKLELDVVKQSVRRGGSVIPTARADELLAEDLEKRSKALDDVVKKLHSEGVRILYVIGGEGSMRAAHAIATVHRVTYPKEPLSVIGVPKTMDNDILWVWQSFGFMSAVEQARQSINQLATEARSNPRVCVIQLFGSVSGFVVSHAALGSDACDLALIPEMDFSMSDVCRYMKERLKSRQRDCPYGLVVMAETAIPNDFEKFKDKQYVGLTDEEKAALEKFKANARQFRGQTPDALRTAALKLVSRTLQRYIHGVMGLGDNAALDKDGELARADSYWKDFRVFTNEPRHIIRSMEPSVTDVAYGIRLGTMAVDTAMAGYTDCMVSQWLTEYVVVPLKLVVLGRKRMPCEGVFWRTVVSKTGQTAYTSLTRAAPDGSDGCDQPAAR